MFYLNVHLCINLTWNKNRSMLFLHEERVGQGSTLLLFVSLIASFDEGRMGSNYQADRGGGNGGPYAPHILSEVQIIMAPSHKRPSNRFSRIPPTSIHPRRRMNEFVFGQQRLPEKSDTL